MNRAQWGWCLLVLLCDVVIAVITRAVVVAGANVVVGGIHNDVANTIIAGCAVGQLL